MDNAYGAVVEDVKAKLPHLELGVEASEEGAERQPSEADVKRYLRDAAAWVTNRTGAIPPEIDGVENPAFAMARTLSILAAASWTESAAHPERSDKSDTTLAGLLWAQFKDGLADLVAALGTSAGPAANRTTGAIATPEPIFRRDMGF